MNFMSLVIKNLFSYHEILGNLDFCNNMAFIREYIIELDINFVLNAIPFKFLDTYDMDTIDGIKFEL